MSEKSIAEVALENYNKMSNSAKEELHKKIQEAFDSVVFEHQKKAVCNCCYCRSNRNYY